MSVEIKIKQTFDSYPNCERLYITSDGNIFDKEMWAKSHANGLYDKDIKVVEREEEKMDPLEEEEEETGSETNTLEEEEEEEKTQEDTDQE